MQVATPPASRPPLPEPVATLTKPLRREYTLLYTSCLIRPARGKDVPDGKFSATATSQQCGAAVLLKRLQDGGRAAVAEGPRVLQLANPHMTGPDIVAVQKLLRKNPFGSFDPGGTDGEFGDLTAGAVQRAKWELGYPQSAVNGTFGPQVQAILSGKKPLPAAFKKRRAQRLKQTNSEQA